MDTALLLIDIQNDYFPGGNMELKGSPEAAQKASRMLGFFRERSWRVVHVQHISVREGATFFVPGGRGVEIYDNVKPLSAETVIEKHYPNAFRETPLLGYLQEQGVRSLVVCGMMTHMCVDTTVRAAFDHGFQCSLISDACATRDLEFRGEIVPADDVQAAFMAALGPIFASVMTTEEYLEKMGV